MAMEHESIHDQWWWTPEKRKPNGHDFKLSEEEFQKHLLEQFCEEKVAGFSETLIQTLREFFDAAVKIGILHEAAKSGYRDTIDSAYEAGKDDAWEDAEWRITKVMETEIADEAYEEGYEEGKLVAEWEAKRGVKKTA
jgi:hypothetical protein